MKTPLILFSITVSTVFVVSLILISNPAPGFLAGSALDSFNPNQNTTEITASDFNEVTKNLPALSSKLENTSEPAGDTENNLKSQPQLEKTEVQPQLPSVKKFSLADIPPTKFNADSVVSINCYREVSEGPTMVYDEVVGGTGFFISSYGHILTNRHLVDPEWTYNAYPNESRLIKSFDYCEAFSLNRGFAVSSASDLPHDLTSRRISIYDEFNQKQLSGAPLRLLYKPNEAGLSQSEINQLDYVILKADLENTPFSPFAVISPENYPDFSGQPVTTIGYGDKFNGLWEVLSAENGDIAGLYQGEGNSFLQLLFNFDSSHAPGRSGSPILFKGYPIALLKSANSTATKNDQGLAVMNDDIYRTVPNPAVFEKVITLK